MVSRIANGTNILLLHPESGLVSDSVLSPDGSGGAKHTPLVTGYGATPLPSMYDALVYEKNVTHVQEEVLRVQKLLNDLAHNIKP